MQGGNPILYQIINTIFRVYYILLFVRVLLSWLPVRSNPVTRFIYEMTEPLLRVSRRILPPSPSFPVDFSPILAFVALEIAQKLVIRLLMAIL